MKWKRRAQGPPTPCGAEGMCWLLLQHSVQRGSSNQQQQQQQQLADKAKRHLLQQTLRPFAWSQSATF